MISNNNLSNFLLVVFVPMIGISLLFSYAFIYVNKEIAILDKELSGIELLNNVQEIIFDVQRLRGLSSIKDRDANSNLEIKTVKKNIASSLHEFKIGTQNGTISKNQKETILKLLNIFDTDIYNNTDYAHLTIKIEHSLLLLKDIAYNSDLLLDSEYNSYILVDIMVSILPELIEYNGQIRAISSSIQNNSITQKQREHIIIKLSKIDEKLNKLKYYMDKAKVNQTQECYQHMLDAESSFIEFIKIELLTKESIMIDPNDIYKLGTQNINYIINIYNNNSKKLKDILKRRVKEKTRISTSIIFVAFASLIFILYINGQFYNNNKKFIKKIKQLSMTDSMTSLLNRRAFDTAFIKRFELAKRDKNIFVFIMLDIDYFKNYNDNYGHQSGDIALKSIASILNSSFSRPDDTVYRLGGEEFGVLFSTNSENGAKEMAQKVLTNIENLNIEHRFSSVAEHITASIGLGIISYNNIENTNTTYVKVDNALYNAKANGRNRYEVIYI